MPWSDVAVFAVFVLLFVAALPFAGLRHKLAEWFQRLLSVALLVAVVLCGCSSLFVVGRLS